MDILITGGTGFVGRAATAALAGRGDRVALWTRDPARAARGLPPGAEAHPWGVLPFPPEGVVNLAGEPVARRWTARAKAEIRASRVEGTRRLVACLSGQAPRVLVSASAVGFYGIPAGEVDESAPPGRGFLAETCQAWEAEAMALAARGTRVTLLRIGLVLGREGGALPRLLLPFRLFLGGPLGRGNQPVSWIHRDDLAALILFALDREGPAGPMNAAAPGPTTMAGLCRALGRALGRPSWLPVPGLLIRALLGEAAGTVLEGARCRPARAEAAGFRFRFPEIGGALADLIGGGRP